MFNNMENQDAVYFNSNNDLSVAVVADGISSCKNSKYGADFVCRIIGEALIDEADFIFSITKREIANIITDYVYNKIIKLANQLGEDPDSFASTLSFICVNKKENKILTFTLGDTLIYLVNKKGVSTVYGTFNDNNCGSYGTTTVDAAKVACVNFSDTNEYDSVLICTDGAWKLCTIDGQINQEVKGYCYRANTDALSDYFNIRHNPDDCTYCFINLAA